MVTIHWFDLDISRAMSIGRIAVTMAAASSTMFFRSVSPLVSFMASPKHPQSFTGLAMNIHTVMSVITTINAVTSFDTRWRCMANSMNMPRANSVMASVIAPVSVSQSGMYSARCMAAA